MTISITARSSGVLLMTAVLFGMGVALFGTVARASNVHLKPRMAHLRSLIMGSRSRRAGLWQG
jgi:hypothetical protein